MIFRITLRLTYRKSSPTSANSNGNLIGYTDRRGNGWGQSFDAANRLVGRSNPLGRTWVYAWDGAGNLVQHTCSWHWCLYTIIDHLGVYGRGAPVDILIHDPWKSPDERPSILTVPTIAGFKEQVQTAEKTFSEVEKKLEKAQDTLEKDWNKVDEAAEEFLEKLGNERNDMSSEIQETKQAIEELKAKVLEAAKQAKEFVDDTKEELEEFEEDVKELEPKVVRVQSGALRTLNVAISQTIVRTALEKNSAILISDIQSDEHLRAQASVVQAQIHSAMCVPLWNNQDIIGTKLKPI